MAAGNALSVEAKLDDKGVLTGVRQMRGELESAASAAQKNNDGYTAMKNILANLATQGIGVAYNAIKNFCSEIVTIGSTFETSMSKVSALSGAMGDDLATLEAKARELGATTTFSASEAADALGYMALAGWDTQQMLDGVGSVLTLAQAGELELAAASDLVTDYLSAFNMEANETSRMVDVLAYAQANANTTVEGLGMAFKNCAANANAAGLDIETTSSLISQMANQGLKGSEAGTALNAVMRDMTAQMEKGAIKIGKTSVAVMDAQGNYRDFVDILADIESATNGMGDAEKAAALQTTFTADSIKGLNLLLNAGSGEAAAFRSELYNCAGTAEQTAATMTDNLGGDLAAMRSALEETALKIYEGLQEPLRSAAQFMTNTVIPAITVLIENADKIAPVLAGVAAGMVVVGAKNRIVESARGLWAKLTAETTANTTATAAHTAATKADIATLQTGTKQLKTHQTTTKTASTATRAYGMSVKAATVEQKTFTVASKAAALGIQSTTTGVKASTVVMNAGKLACKGLSAALKTIAPIAVMTALIEVATIVGGVLEENKKQAEDYSKATDGMAEALNAGEQAFNSYKPAVDGATEANNAVRISAQEVIASQAELAEKTRETWSNAGTDAAVVSSYADTMARLAEKGNLTAAEQEELKLAVESFNEATGESIGIVNAQTGELNTSREAILKMADAYKQEAMAEAARELYKDHAKQLIQNEVALTEAKRNLESAQKSLNEETDPSLLGQYNAQVQACQAEVDKLTQVSEAEKNAMQSVWETMSSGVSSYETLDIALQSCGVTMASFGDLTEGQLAALESGFDGSLNSIVSTCATQGIAIPTSLANAIKGNMGLPEDAQQVMFDAMVLQMTGGDVAAAAAILGHDIDQGLVDGITGNSEMPAEAIGVMSDEVINRAKTHFDSHSPSLVMQQLGSDIDAGLSNGISGNASGPAGAMSALGATVLGAIQGIPGQASITGTSAGDNLASGINSASSKVSGAAGRIASSALSGVEISKDNFTRAGKNAVDGFGNTIGNADAYNQARSLAVTAERGLSTVRGDTAGIQFGQGYGLGIQSQNSYVYQMAHRLGEQAINGVKDAQRSASPSKVARSLGGDYGQGYGLGIEDEYGFVEQKSKGLVESALSEPIYPTVGIDWYSTAGKYNSASMLGLSSGTELETLVVPSSGESSNELLRELLNEIKMIRKDLPVLFATFCLRTLELNEREFARLVREVLG